MNRLIGYFIIALAGAWVLTGCGSGVDGELVPNSPPETRVTQTPPVLGQTEFNVSFFWTGSDRDGEVTGFEWRISDNGFDGVVSVADTMGLPWNTTTATDSTFTVSADLDSFQIDVEDPQQGPNNYRFWQTHTFFIRAVDDQGARDPQPASVSFTATTIAPTINVNVPQVQTSTSCTGSARVLTFGWDGNDPDDVVGEPVAVRYILYDLADIPIDFPESSASDEACLTRNQYETLNPIGQLSRDDPRWSRWIDYNAAQDSGRAVTLPRAEVDKKFLFAAQAQDKAGAVTPTFVWGRNVRHVRISNSKRPTLLVNERFLGGELFAAPVKVRVAEIVAGQPLEFSWSADASEYAGIIEAFRYGWNVLDFEDPDDPGWEIQWGNTPLHVRSPVRSFFEGSPNFVVQVRDNSGTVNTAIYQFEVVQIPERANQRDLVLVDDWIIAGSEEELQFEARWDQEWTALLQDKVTNWDPQQDIIDVQEDGDRIEFKELSFYKSMVWFTNGNAGSRFHNEFAPLNLVTPQFNWLEVYQSRVGNLLICGPQILFNSLERQFYSFPIVFDVPDRSPDGFGTEAGVGGIEFNRGTTRWPYTAYCLEAIDFIRPSSGEIWGEPQNLEGRRRTNDCDRLMFARADEDFLANNPSAVGTVLDLDPIEERLEDNPRYLLRFEEFYNLNGTGRPVTLNFRDCQETMFRHEARRDAFDPRTGEPFVDFPDSTCTPTGRNSPWQDPPGPGSTINGAPIGVASSIYSDTKLLRNSRDYVWGFHPLAFEARDVQSALLWIMQDDWRIAVQR